MDHCLTNKTHTTLEKKRLLVTRNKECNIVDLPVNNGINDNLNRVQVSQEMDDLHGVLDDPHSHQLLTVVPSVHHERVCEPLNDWALSLPEPLHRVSSSSVGDKGRVLSRLNTNVVNKTNVCDLPIHKNNTQYQQNQY